MQKILKPFLAVVLSLMLALGGLGVASASSEQNKWQQDISQTAPQDSRLVISDPGVYTLTGNMKGTVWVDPGYGEVTLILDNAAIDGGNAPAIVGMSGDRLNILTQENSVNTILSQWNTYLENRINAAVYSYMNLLFGGSGTLDLRSSTGYGAFSEQGSMSFNGGNYYVSTGRDGFATGNPAGNPIEYINGTFQVNSDIFRIQSPVTDPIVPDQFVREQNSQNTVPVQNALYTEPSQNTGSSAAPQNAPFQQPQENASRQAVPSDPASQPGQTGDSTQTFLPNQSGIPGRQNQNSTTLPSMPDWNGQNGLPNGNMAGYDSASEPSALAEGITSNSAMTLTADYDNATTYDVSETSQVKITSSGTYVVTGTSEDGNITVKKGTTGVVLVLEDLDLTSTTGATLSVNKQAEVQVIVSGNVTLTDNENPADENSSDADVADAYDGAAIKVKAESMVYITGSGTLNINGNAKNGIKGGDDSSIIFGGNVAININAENDGINSNYDLAFLGGKMRINAGDDGIHADHIVTIGKEDGTGPEITIENSNEGIEGTVVNIRGGKIDVTAEDDGINAANGDGLYEGELGYAINMTGGEVTVHAGYDGFDSNGDVNLIGGRATINSANNGGDAGIDYDGQLYVSDGFALNNHSGVAGPDYMMQGGNQNFGPMSETGFGNQFAPLQSQEFGGMGNMPSMPGNPQGGFRF